MTKFIGTKEIQVDGKQVLAASFEGNSGKTWEMLKEGIPEEINRVNEGVADGRFIASGETPEEATQYLAALNEATIALGLE